MSQVSISSAPFSFYLTGLPAAGKSTLARGLAAALRARGYDVHVLDADEVRQHLHLVSGRAFTDPARDQYYHLLAYVASLLAEHGVVVIVAATANRRAYREQARRALPNMLEVYVRCPPAVCEARDPKGLWARARAGEITNFPGVDAPYEVPEHPDVVVDTDRLTPEEAVRRVLEALPAD